jgi:hypothetical protein
MTKYSFVIETNNGNSSIILIIESTIGCNKILARLFVCDANDDIGGIPNRLFKIFSEGFKFVDNNGYFEFFSRKKNAKITITNDYILIGDSRLEGIFMKLEEAEDEIFDAIGDFQSLYGL